MQSPWEFYAIVWEFYAISPPLFLDYQRITEELTIITLITVIIDRGFVLMTPPISFFYLLSKVRLSSLKTLLLRRYCGGLLLPPQEETELHRSPVWEIGAIRYRRPPPDPGNTGSRICPKNPSRPPSVTLSLTAFLHLSRHPPEAPGGGGV